MNDSTVVIQCYQKVLGLPSQRWRWRAVSLANGKKLANGGEGYGDPADLARTLGVLFAGRHRIVGLP